MFEVQKSCHFFHKTRLFSIRLLILCSLFVTELTLTNKQETVRVDFTNPKVHWSKGRAQTIVYIWPSKNKLDRLKNKKYLFTCTYCFLLNPVLQETNYLFRFKKHKIVRYLIILYIPWQTLWWKAKMCPSAGIGV